MATLHDGLQTILTIGDTNLVCEIEVTPPSLDGGDPIDLSCMRSGEWALMYPRRRKKVGPMTILVSWNPEVYRNLAAGVVDARVFLNLNQLMQLRFPNGAVLSFYGFITKFEPQAMKEGERPTANITIQLSLLDPYCNASYPTLSPGTTTC